MGAVPELDLSASCHPSTIVDRISAVPGLRPSAGEFADFCYFPTHLARSPSRCILAIWVKIFLVL